jgi:hypothetical protein
MGSLGYRKPDNNPNMVVSRKFTSVALKNVGCGTGYSDLFGTVDSSVDEVVQPFLIEGQLIIQGVISAVH